MYRKNFLLLSALLVTSASGAPSRDWISREFLDTWNAPDSGFQALLNTECRPSGLDGIQVFAVQKGHGSAFNLHVSCRKDGVSTARYSVRLLDVPRGHLDERVGPLVSNPRLRIGPFFFGKIDGPDGIDGILIIEKTR